jgi:hypothetical protein
LPPPSNRIRCSFEFPFSPAQKIQSFHWHGFARFQVLLRSLFRLKRRHPFC